MLSFTISNRLRIQLSEHFNFFYIRALLIHEKRTITAALAKV
jgi:hypothetical protein